MPSIFASRSRKMVVIGEGDDIINVQIQKLSGRSLEKASEQRQISVGAAGRAMGPELFKAMAGDDPKPVDPDEPPPVKVEPPLEKKKQFRYATYDRHTVLVQSVQSWDAKAPDGKDLPVSEKNLGDLEEKWAQNLFEQIIDFSLGPIEAKEVEEQLVKD